MGLVNLVVWPENDYGIIARIGYGDFVFSFFLLFLTIWKV